VLCPNGQWLELLAWVCCVNEGAMMLLSPFIVYF
jgi:hypothetical protein